MEKMILGKCGEVVLKGLNRRVFEKILLQNIRAQVAKAGDFSVYIMQSTVYVQPVNENSDTDMAYALMKKVFGLSGICLCYKCEKNIEAICKCAVEYINDLDYIPRTFKVESKRADKTFSLKSPEISRLVGGYILENMPGISVNVHTPSLTVFVEVREQYAFIHSGNAQAAGGMPYGSNGKAMLLLSGGIDSPVAGHMIAKRGLNIECIHFFSHPYTSERSKQKVLDLAGVLCDYCGGKVKVHVVPFTEIQEEIAKKCDEDMFTLVMRSFMMQISEKIARKRYAGALATGECIGQVASQTLQALNVTNSMTDMLVLRPLIALDKNEVIARSREIGAYEISTLPYEDCCTVFTPKHPKTKPNFIEVKAQQDKLDVQNLIERAVEGSELICVTK